MPDIIDILENKVITPSSIYLVLAQDHGIHSFAGFKKALFNKRTAETDAGLGKHFNQHELVTSAFNINKNGPTPTATIQSPQKLYELARCFKEEKETFSKNDYKYATCLAFLYNHLERNDFTHSLRKTAFDELRSLYDTNGPLKNAKILAWLKKIPLYLQPSEPTKSVPLPLPKESGFAKLHNLFMPDEKKVDDKKIEDTVKNLLTEMANQPKGDNIKAYKKAQEDFLLNKLPTLSHEALDHLLTQMEKTQEADEKHPPQTGPLSKDFLIIRTKQFWGAGEQGSTKTWKRLMSAVKEELLQKIDLVYKDHRVPGEKYDHYMDLFGFHSSSFFKFNLKNDPSKAAASQQEFTRKFTQY